MTNGLCSNSFLLRLAFVLSCFVSGPAAAITVDSFDGQQSVTAEPFQETFSAIAAPSAIGGSRAVKVIGATGVAGLQIRALTVAGVLSHSQEATVTGSSRITWDGEATPALNPAGLGGIDFYQDGATAMRIEIQSFDFAGGKPLSLTLTVYDSTDPAGNKSSSATITLTGQIVAYTNVVIPFSSFTANGVGGGVDFHNVGAISLFVDGKNPEVDLVLDWVGTNGKCIRLPDANKKVIDLCGVCGGDNSSCSDCVGVPNGTNVKGSPCENGQFGVCRGGTWSQTCQCKRNVEPSGELCDGLDNDCDQATDEAFPLLGQGCGFGSGVCAINGVYTCAANGGMVCDADAKSATYEACENSKGCDGVPGSGLVLDICNLCGGNGTSCLDCNGLPFGTSVLDQCNVCNGANDTCLGCNEKDQTPLLTALDGGAKRQEAIIKTTLSDLRRLKKDGATKRWIEATLKEAHRLQIRNWNLSWTLPRIATVCTNTTLCTAESNTWILEEYRSNADKLRQLSYESVRRLIKARGKRTARETKYQSRTDSVFSENMKLADTVPVFQSECGGKDS
ncbi:MAG: hypothetical protein IT290_12310 [Deltaproteobacteria bacterium]|nr:hypothetical protein [Deltaproteobacteria bacterium]